MQEELSIFFDDNRDVKFLKYLCIKFLQGKF